MKNELLTIQLLSFDRPTKQTEKFYFHEMSTLQATTLLPPDKKIIGSKIFAHTEDNTYLDEHTTKSFKTIGDFNNFFLNNPDYHIHNCNIELEGEILINSHDDGEVSVQYTSDNANKTIINNIFEKYHLDKKLLEILKTKQGHYITIDKQNNIVGDFKNFDDYLENGRSKKNKQ